NLDITKDNLQVHKNEHMFDLQIEILNRQLVHYFNTSLMTSRSLQLNPHSLSYQENTFTMRSPTALVSGPSTIDECGLWRKSTETSSSSENCRTPFSGPLAAAFNASLTDCIETGFAVLTVRSTTETSGVGTRIATPSSLP